MAMIPVPTNKCIFIVLCIQLLSNFTNNQAQVHNSMYGRGNIFSNSSNYNSGSSNNNPNSSNRLGSQRLDYRHEEPPSYLTSIIFQWKQQPPSSIVTREETLHLTTTELRIEDYHSMRKQQIRATLENKLKDAIRSDSFNQDILNFQFDKLPPVSQERPLDIDAIRGGRAANRGSSGNIFASNSSSSNTSNIFNRNSNSGSNIFGNNSSSGYNNSSGNVFSNSQSGNRGNIFSNGNSNNSNNSGSSYGSGSIFNRGSSGGGGNIFSNNNGGNNIFSGNNNNQSNNIFNSNNRSSNNIFSNNQNNSNNIFSNRNNNNNNIFSNNGNNLFNNNNNNAVSIEFINSIKSLFEQNQHFMRMMAQEMNLTSKPRQDYDLPQESPFDQLIKDQPFAKFQPYVEDNRRNHQVIICKPKQTDGYNQMGASKIGSLREGSIIGSRKMQRSKLHQTNSQIISNSTNNSKILGGTRLYLKGTESRMVSHKSSIRQPSRLPEIQDPCILYVYLKVIWTDDIYKQMPEQVIEETLEMSSLKPSSGQWRKELVYALKKIIVWARQDADIIVEEIGENRECMRVKGVIQQKIVNLPNCYRVSYSKIKNQQIYSLSISNQYGTIAWQRPISAKQLEFSRLDEESFYIGDNTISCEIQALNSRCRVTFFTLPSEIYKAYSKDPNLARHSFEEFVATQSQGAFTVQDMWVKDNTGGWSMIVTHFPKNPKET